MLAEDKGCYLMGKEGTYLGGSAVAGAGGCRIRAPGLKFPCEHLDLLGNVRFVPADVVVVVVAVAVAVVVVDLVVVVVGDVAVAVAVAVVGVVVIVVVVVVGVAVVAVVAVVVAVVVVVVVVVVIAIVVVVAVDAVVELVVWVYLEYMMLGCWSLLGFEADEEMAVCWGFEECLRFRVEPY